MLQNPGKTNQLDSRVNLVESENSAMIRRLLDPTNLIINRLTSNTNAAYDDYGMREVRIW